MPYGGLPAGWNPRVKDASVVHRDDPHGLPALECVLVNDQGNPVGDLRFDTLEDLRRLITDLRYLTLTHDTALAEQRVQVGR